MGLFDLFKKKTKEVCGGGAQDLFEIKPCVSGIHEFTAVVVHRDQCEATLARVHYVCKKCRAMYFGRTPEKYGTVVEEIYEKL